MTVYAQLARGCSLKKILVHPPKKSKKIQWFFDDLKSVYLIWEWTTPRFQCLNPLLFIKSAYTQKNPEKNLKNLKKSKDCFDEQPLDNLIIDWKLLELVPFIPPSCVISMSLVNDSRAKWIHSSLGSLTIDDEVISGIFRENSKSSAEAVKSDVQSFF